MISFVTFDPATMAVWCDQTLLRPRADREVVIEVMNAAFAGRNDRVSELANAVDESTKWVCFDVAGAMWHEKRHYVDVLLTSYGALHWRFFFELAAMFGDFIDAATELGEPVVMPLDVYASPIRRRALGIGRSSPSLDILARRIARRKRYLATENAVHPHLFGRAVGGEAMLESLGALCQEINMLGLFGTSDFEQWLRVRDYEPRSNARYDFHRLGVATKLMPLESHSELGQILNHAIVTAICYASLMGRTWGETSDPGSMATGQPSVRFAALAEAIESSPVASYQSISTGDAWELVNATAKRLWGRSAVDDLEADYEAEGEFIGGFDDESPVKAVATGWHVKRGVLIELLKQAPRLFLTMGSSSKYLLARVNPSFISFDSGGQCSPPGDPHHVYRAASDFYPQGWTWANCAQPLDEPLRDWFELVPIFRLMVNGMREPMRAGNELQLAQANLHAHGIRVRYPPSYRCPDDLDATKGYFRLAPPEGLHCRFCGAMVKPGEGRLLTTFHVRGNSLASKKAIDVSGGGFAGIGVMGKDWSPWLACKRCLEEFGDCTNQSTEIPLPYGGKNRLTDDGEFPLVLSTWLGS